MVRVDARTPALALNLNDGGVSSGVTRLLRKSLHDQQTSFAQGPPDLRPGSRLLRQWNGREHVVDVTAAGIEWEGRRDRSITGAKRPALARLLDEIRVRWVDVVVVYKVDRLTRSLSDFAKMVEVFDAHDASFVSARCPGLSSAVSSDSATSATRAASIRHLDSVAFPDVA